VSAELESQNAAKRARFSQHSHHIAWVTLTTTTASAPPSLPPPPLLLRCSRAFKKAFRDHSK
jgi:hypothetical protein